jgi:OOP family OmpA-OmpF porin
MIKTARKLLLTTSATVLLGACASNWDVEGVQQLPEPADQFKANLHQEYAGLALAERNEQDWGDTKEFLLRSRVAAANGDILPEDIANRDLPANTVGDLQNARMRMMAAFDQGGRTVAPELAAKAQTSFDCWMQEQEENHQPEDIAACRKAFDVAMAALEDALKPKEPQTFVLFFDFNSAALTPESKATLQKVFTAYSEMDAESVSIVGHTDTVGKPAYNQKLSETRAQAVAKALADMGINGEVGLSARGETMPKIAGDNKKEKMNRRVVVTIK